MQKKINIGIDARVLEWQRGALANFTINLIEKWMNNNDKYNFYLYFQNSIPDDIFFSENLNLVVIKGPIFLKKYKILCEQILLPRALKKNSINIFLATIYSYPFLFFRKKTILFLWDITFSTHKSHYGFIRGNIYHYLSYYSSKNANHIITCSNYDLKIISQVYNIKNKISYIDLPSGSKFNYINDDNVKIKFITKYKIPSEYFLSLGVIYNRRNIDKLIKAIELINSKNTKKINLVLVGSDATNPKLNIQDIISKSACKNNIFYFTFFPQADLNKLYSFSLSYICTSINDGESIMLKEATMSGTSVITNKLLSSSVNNSCFLIDNPNDTNSWVTGLNFAVTNISNRSTLNQDAYKYVKNLTWGNVINHIENKITKIL